MAEDNQNSIELLLDTPELLLKAANIFCDLMERITIVFSDEKLLVSNHCFILIVFICL